MSSPTILDLNRALAALQARLQIADSAGAAMTASRLKSRLDRIQARLRACDGQGAYALLLEGNAHG